MRDLGILFIHLIVTIARLFGSGGARSIVAESLLVKHQLLILNRSRARVPDLRPTDRAIVGLCAILMRPTSLRRELLDHVIILNERHLKRLLSSYLDYYHPWRTHRSLDQDAPDGGWVRLVELGQIVEFPVVQGLHHYHLPRAA